MSLQKTNVHWQVSPRCVFGVPVVGLEFLVLITLWKSDPSHLSLLHQVKVSPLNRVMTLAQGSSVVAEFVTVINLAIWMFHDLCCIHPHNIPEKLESTIVLAVPRCIGFRELIPGYHPNGRIISWVKLKKSRCVHSLCRNPVQYEQLCKLAAQLLWWEMNCKTLNRKQQGGWSTVVVSCLPFCCCA